MDHVGELVPPDFFTMTDQEQLHVLAVAIVACERYYAVRELLLTARMEIRTGVAPEPGVALLHRCCRGARREVKAARSA